MTSLANWKTGIRMAMPSFFSPSNSCRPEDQVPYLREGETPAEPRIIQKPAAQRELRPPGDNVKTMKLFLSHSLRRSDSNVAKGDPTAVILKAKESFQQPFFQLGKLVNSSIDNHDAVMGDSIMMAVAVDFQAVPFACRMSNAFC